MLSLVLSVVHIRDGRESENLDLQKWQSREVKFKDQRDRVNKPGEYRLIIVSKVCNCSHSYLI